MRVDRVHAAGEYPEGDGWISYPLKDEWIERVCREPEQEFVQADGRVRRWARIDAMDGRYLRVVLLPDGETVHNAFFDRSFRP